MDFAHRRLIVLLVGSVLIGATLGAPVASATTADVSPSPGGISYQAGEPTNNTSVQQEDPSAVSSEDDLSQLQSWLSGRLTQTAINCSQGVEVGNYNACNRSNGNYPDWLSDYVNVTRESDSSNNTTKSFQRTAENQSEYASDVRRFRNTIDQYEEARNNSNTQRARRLARRAQQLASEVNETSGNLTRGYAAISNETSQNLSVANRATRNVSQNVTTTAEDLVSEQFVNTTISASAAGRQISFRNPLPIAGRVATENGTALANQTVRLRVDGRTQGRATTDERGIYSLQYRPTRAPLDTDRVTLQYLPESASVYNSSETSVSVDIRQVQPTLQANRTPGEVGFGDQVTVAGRLAVNDTGAGSMPIAISVDGTELRLSDGTRAGTASDGRFRQSSPLPKTVNTGQHTLRVSQPLENRSLGRVNTSLPITVRSTPTSLSINATQVSVNGSNVSGPVVGVSGRLATNGQPLRNESVALTVNGTDTETVTTNENGRYTANISVPESTFAGSTGTVPMTFGARYAGVNTNLQASNARITLRIDVPTETTSLLERLQAFLGTLIEDLPWYVWPPAVLAVLVVGYLAIRAWDRSDSDQENPADEPPSVETTTPVDDSVDWDELLQAAKDQFETDERAGAVASAYAAARTKLRRDTGMSGAYTHWEFLDASRSVVDERRRASLERLTELYERAVFSPYPLTEDMASTALADAETVSDVDTDTDVEVADESDVDDILPP